MSAAARAGLPAPGDLRALLRHFPYTMFLVVFLPLYGYLAAAGRLRLLDAALWTAPFVCLLAAGYAHNNLLDLADPPSKANPVAAGRIDLRQARALALVLAGTGLLVFTAGYHRPLAYLLFAGWVGLLFAYNGLGIRLKESWLGPVAAVLVLWVGGPVVLAVETGLVEPYLWLLLAAAGLVFLGREIWHTITDAEEDRRAGWRTFAVRAGPARAEGLQRAALLAGCALLLASCLMAARAAGGRPQPWLLMAPLVGLTATAALFAGRIGRSESGAALAYALARLCFVAFALLLLALEPAATVLLLWLFLTSKVG